MLELELAWPDKRMHPNAREHWTKVAPVKKKFRAVARRKTRAALPGAKLMPKREKARWTVTLHFHPPELERRRDLDGMFSSMKASIDGIADAMGVDDNLFNYSMSLGEPRGKGCVLVTVR